MSLKSKPRSSKYSPRVLSAGITASIISSTISPLPSIIPRISSTVTPKISLTIRGSSVPPIDTLPFSSTSTSNTTSIRSEIDASPKTSLTISVGVYPSLIQPITCSTETLNRLLITFEYSSPLESYHWSSSSSDSKIKSTISPISILPR